MIVGFAAAIEHNAYLRINAGAPLVFEICSCCEAQPVEASRRMSIKVAATAVGIGGAFGQQQP